MLLLYVVIRRATLYARIFVVVEGLTDLTFALTTRFESRTFADVWVFAHLSFYSSKIPFAMQLFKVTQTYGTI